MGFWLNQALGLLGSLIVFASVQFNNRRVILAAQAAACLMWIVHYGLLGATTAATINILSFARSVVFYFNDRKWAQSRAWLWAFLALYVVNTVLTWAGPMSLLPGIAMSMTTVALWTRDMRRTRLLYLTNSPFWFTYRYPSRARTRAWSSRPSPSCPTPSPCGGSTSKNSRRHKKYAKTPRSKAGSFPVLKGALEWLTTSARRRSPRGRAARAPRP
ncbi:MAG: YgjV family protein [Oscillospiraceae bacterium]